MVRACAMLCSALILSLFAFGGQAEVGQTRTGLYRGRKVTYQVINGQNIFEGDIVLDHVDEPDPSSVGTPGIGIIYPANFWPKVGNVFQIPYTITSGDQKVTDSINSFNTIFAGFMQWVPRTTEADYVDFNLDVNDHSQVCNSSVGRVGGKQTIGGSIDCANQLHEMGHAVGLFHEQSRSDRNTFVSILFPNIIKTLAINFDQIQDNGQDVGLYDYASIMHYGAYTFSKNGKTTMESIPAGIPLVSAYPGYSAGDIDTVKRIYGAAPTAVTVTSNPLGLQVTVDGAQITTPQTFNWTLNSTHTLSAPTTVQTLNSTPYIYARWNDSTAASHTITVTPGIGLVAQPVTSPAVTVYSADFSMLVPYSATVFPANSGTVNTTPPAQSFPGGTGVYYTARQLVTLQATPGGGQSFYGFYNSPFWLPYSLSVNPKTFNAPEDGNGINMQVLFTSSPVYTFGTNLSDVGAGVLVDGGFWYAPIKFSPAYDSGFTTGSAHTIGTFDPQIPFVTTIRYPFQNWSDGGALNHGITLPATSTAYTANFGAQYQLFDFPNQPCAATVNVTPTSNDGFYDGGTLLTFTETPLTGWTFTGWQHDLSGTQTPITLTASDEMYVTADYNTVSTPISVSSLSPASAVAGGAGFTLTINGAGFTSNTGIFLNGTFRTATFVNSGKLTVPVNASDIATPGGFQVFVQNFPNGASCAAYSTKSFLILNGVGTSASVSPGSVSFGKQAAGTSSNSQAVTLTNTGSNALTIGSIAASGGFTQTNDCPGSLGAGLNCTIDVRFAPVALGAMAGVLTIVDNAGSSPQLVTLTGTSVAPLTFKPATLAMGTVAVGNSSSKSVTVTNNQTTTLNLSFATGGNFSLSGGTCGASLAGKANCTITVKFQPTASGAVSGALIINDNALYSPQAVSLTGTGTGGPAVPLSFNPASVSFAATGVGVTSAPKTVTVTNTSASAVSITSLTAGGNFSAAGSGTTPCGGSLGAGAKCTFAVTFTPSIPAAIKGGVAIATSVAGSPQNIAVKGTGKAPVTLAPTSLTFAAQAVGTTSSAKTVTLTNLSGGTLAIASIFASGDYAIVSAGTKPCGATVAANGKCTFGVTFTPNATGTISGAVTVTHNAPLGPAAIKLKGTGQ